MSSLCVASSSNDPNLERMRSIWKFGDWINVRSFTYRRSDHTKAGVTVDASAAAAKYPETRAMKAKAVTKIFMVL